MPSTRTQRRRQPVRTQQRRAPVAGERPTRRALEPVDYSQDYAYARKDMLRILLWGGLLFAGMVAYFFYLQFI